MNIDSFPFNVIFLASNITLLSCISYSYLHYDLYKPKLLCFLNYSIYTYVIYVYVFL